MSNIVNVFSLGFSILALCFSWNQINNNQAKMEMVDGLFNRIVEINEQVGRIEIENKAILDKFSTTAITIEDSSAHEREANIPKSGPEHMEEINSANTLSDAHVQWIENEYPNILDTTRSNAKEMVKILERQMDLSNEDMHSIENVFADTSIRIADIFAYADNLNNTQEINSEINEINKEREDSLKKILSEVAFKRYKSINWMKEMSRL